MSIAYVGIGANLGDPCAQVRRAFDELDAIPGTRVTARSSLYRTAPLGADGQPDYVNAVARIDTALAPAALLGELRAMEDRHGRNRPFRNAPRTLDLDLLLYERERILADELTVPHPRMHERAFVLVPLSEIAPGAEIPGLGLVEDWLARCAGQAIERID